VAVTYRRLEGGAGVDATGTYAANNLNQYTSVTNAVVVNPTYDLNGNHKHKVIGNLFELRLTMPDLWT